ncbi:MAG: CHAT domain-containing protein [Bryobacteraceae bacterium]
MRNTKALACCLLVLPLIGTARRTARQVGARALSAAAYAGRTETLTGEFRKGVKLVHDGRYAEAQLQFEKTYAAAMSAGDPDLAARAEGKVGVCQFALRQYQPALKSFFASRRLAQSSGDASAVAISEANIASLYSEMGEVESAAQWMTGNLERLSGPDRAELRPKFLIQMAILRARQDRMPQALDLFRQGIAAADDSADPEICAMGWNRLGEEYLQRGDLEHAEPALLEAYRIRKLGRLPLDTSYRSLGRLRLEQGDLVSASALLDRAVELAPSPQGVVPTWDVYHYRGRVRLAQGRFREALEDLRIALRLARAWLRSAPADDASRMGAEGWLEKVYAALIEAGNRLYLETRDPALIRETFEAAEENRASSLRALMGANRPGAGLPQSYWATIAHLQRAEVEALRSGAPDEGDAVRADLAVLVRMEAAVTPGTDPLPAALLERTQSALGGDAALLSFQLDNSASWLWALDRQGLALYVLPPRREIEALAQPARDAIRDASPDAIPAGAALYRALFGRLAPRFRAKTRWLLALDQGCFNTDLSCADKLVASLFDIPFAALPESTRPRTVYVAEKRVTEIVPGAGFWLDSEARWSAPSDSSLFLGVGDPIYNLADPRLPESLRPAPSWFPLNLFRGRSAAKPGLVLPRLVASASELNACSQAWGGASVLLEGRDAARRQIAEQMKRNPLIAHFATHVLEFSGKPSYGLIALSLTGDGESQVLDPLEIARWQIHTEIVVLSGCHSAAGAALNATGLLGLTRAWLAAGARTVVGSRWPTPDDDGALFSAMYRRLRSQPRRDAAGALRAAQLEMIRSASWRSSPRYWGAYFAVGNE